MNQYTHQTGFAHLVAIVGILAVIAGVGASGYYVYRHSQRQPATVPPATSTKQANSTDSAAKPAADAQAYLTIKEWGVRLPLADADKLTYTLSSSDEPSGRTEAASMLLKPAIVANIECRELAVSLLRIKHGNGQMMGTAQTVGAYDYYMQGSPGACMEEGKADANSAVNQLRAKLSSQELADARIELIPSGQSASRQ